MDAIWNLLNSIFDLISTYSRALSLVQDDQPDKLNSLLEKSSNPKSICNRTDPSGTTLLMMAAQNGFNINPNPKSNPKP